MFLASLVVVVRRADYVEACFKVHSSLYFYMRGLCLYAPLSPLGMPHLNYKQPTFRKNIPYKSRSPFLTLWDRILKVH